MKRSISAKREVLYITSACFLLVSFACSPAVPVTATAAPSVTVAPIPSLTETAAPSATVPPSATPLPTATITPLAADLGRVVFSESFDDLTFLFGVYGPSRIESGAVVMEREPGYTPPPDMWPTGGIYGTTPITPGTTTVILFKAKHGTAFNIGYHNNAYGTDGLRRFSFDAGTGTWDIYTGKEEIKRLNGRQPRSDTWHYFSITRSAQGDIDAKLWERDKPENTIEFHGNLGPEWGTLQLTFVIDFRWGAFMLDEYQHLRND